MRPLLLVPLVLLTSCDQSPVSRPAAPTPILTTFYPTTYFATRIASGKLAIDCPCPANVDPAEWTPTREALARYQAAPLILVNGASYEQWLSSASLIPSRIIDTSGSFRDSYLSYGTITHNHGPGGAHTHAGVDAHTWLDPINAQAQAASILAAFTAHAPSDTAVFSAAFASLERDLAALDTRFRELSPLAKNAVILASHPAYGYLARRYGWTITNVDVPPDEEPPRAGWQAVLDAAQAAPADAPRLLLFESEPLSATRERLLRDWGFTAVVFSPCETPQGGADYLARMNANLDSLRDSLTQKGH